MADDCPRLRYLDAFPIRDRGKDYVVLRDPAQISDRVVIITPEFFRLLPLFNGENTLEEIREELTRSCGETVVMADVLAIVEQLDKARFLDSSAFHSYYSSVLQDFRRSKTRPAYHAGTAYPSDSNELFETISSFYTKPNGGGIPGSSRSTKITGLVAPHIDLRTGGATYTHAYRALAESDGHDLFVILGTGHMGLPDMFSISPKAFETPLGTSQPDKEFLEALGSRLPEPVFTEDLSHRHEHTIEFQLVFLHHLFRTTPPPILPVLCSFSYADVDPVSANSRLSLFTRFLEGFKQALAETSRRVCFVASVDFAHMGPRYGDSFTPDEKTIAEARSLDREMIGYLEKGDAEGFRAFIAGERDRRRICGFPALYTMLRLLETSRGRLLAHDHTVMDQTGSFVTYASMAFWE